MESLLVINEVEYKETDDSIDKECHFKALSVIALTGSSCSTWLMRYDSASDASIVYTTKSTFTSLVVLIAI